MIISGGVQITNGVQIYDIPTLNIISSNLVMYVDAGLTSSYPGSGTTWTDLSGSNNNLTFQNSGSITYYSTGGGYFSTGSNGYFSIASGNNIPTGNSTYCLSVWVQMKSGTSVNGFVGIGNGYGTTNAVNAFRVSSTNALVNYWWGNDLTVAYAVTTNWINAVAQYDGTTRSIWVNGTQISSDTPVGHNVTNSYVSVALTWPTQSEYLQGNIGQALIYNRALTSTEITQNFTATRSRFGV